VRLGPDSTLHLFRYLGAEHVGNPASLVYRLKESGTARAELLSAHSFIAIGPPYTWRDGASPVSVARDMLPAILRPEDARGLLAAVEDCIASQGVLIG
jgi:hypothetical protein